MTIVVCAEKVIWQMIGQRFDVQYTFPAPLAISACHVDHVVLYSTTETVKIINFNLYTRTW